MNPGRVSHTMLEIVKEASARASRGGDPVEADKLDWLFRVLLKMRSDNNYQFFRHIGKRKDSAQLLRRCLCTLRDSPDRNWILHEAEKVFGANVPPVWPKLLEIVREFIESNN